MCLGRVVSTLTSAQPSQGGLPQWSGDERPPTLSPDLDEAEKLETYANNKLVEDGGPAGIPDQLPGPGFQGPISVYESLRPWLVHPDSGNLEDYRKICSRQRDHWREFRRWQLRNRGMPDRKPFAEHFEERKWYDELTDGAHIFADST